ncbi:MAG: PAS domain-containing protein [Proteobacteria bacterium]|nr:PAS domain-containing protein [Pseudomonadota bacterium]
MNAQKKPCWIEKFHPDTQWDATIDQETSSKEGSNALIKMDGIQFASSVLHNGNSYLDQTETETHAQQAKLSCLYAISRVMLTARTVEDLCQPLIEHMRFAWLPCDRFFPFVEIDGKCFTVNKSAHLLPYQYSVPVVIDGAIAGQVGVFSDDIHVAGWPENEDSVFLKNIARDLAIWWQQNQLAVAQNLLMNDVCMIENAFNAHAIVAITEKSGEIRYVNEKFCSVSKYSAKELIGQDHRIVNSSYHPKEFMADLWTTITEGKVWRGEIKNRAKDGTYYWVDTTIVPFLDDQGVPYQYVGIRTEVTNYKQLEQKMEEQVTELARSNDELEQFAYVVTHDLQEPLRAINSFVQLLKKYCDHQLDERAKDLISHAVAGTNRMQVLIDDLLTYAQVNASQSLIEIDCEQLLKNVLTDLSVVIGECNALVTYDKLPVLKGIRFQFIQLFTNLINNALKFRRNQPPQIHIGVEENRREWIFSVIDNGIGIEEQYLERIFRVFQRLHSRREYAGTGIGLAICKKVVEHHGGKIWVKSTHNIGSSFYFTIPKN